jgi:hypothetical protein
VRFWTVLAIVALATPARAEPDATWVVEAPFALGVAGGLGVGTHSTVGGHLAWSQDGHHLHVGAGAEWTLLIGKASMPQGWITLAPELATANRSWAIYLGPTLRGYELDAGGPQATLAAELGTRALLYRSVSPRRRNTIGFYARATIPVLGRGWTASLCLAVGPPL